MWRSICFRPVLRNKTLFWERIANLLPNRWMYLNLKINNGVDLQYFYYLIWCMPGRTDIWDLGHNHSLCRKHRCRLTHVEIYKFKSWNICGHSVRQAWWQEDLRHAWWSGGILVCTLIKVTRMPTFGFYDLDTILLRSCFYFNVFIPSIKSVPNNHREGTWAIWPIFSNDRLTLMARHNILDILMHTIVEFIKWGNLDGR